MVELSKNRAMKLFTFTGPAMAAALLIAATGCSSDPKASSALKPNTDNSNLSFEQKRELLLTFRAPGEVCTSDSGECMLWTNLALHCERQYNGETTSYDKPCSSMETFRERITGIDLSSAPGAYSF